MKTVYLIRHAEFENPHKVLGGRLPLPLSEAGVAQAHRAGEHLAKSPLDVIYSSQVLRSEQTSVIIREHQSSKPEVLFDARLLETFSSYQGFWEDNIFEGGLHFFAHQKELGGETLADIQKRVVSFWDEVIVSNPAEQIAVCSHDFCLLTLLKHLKSLLLPEPNAAIYHDSDYLPKAGVCTVTIQDGKVAVGDIVSL